MTMIKKKYLFVITFSEINNVKQWKLIINSES